MNVLGDVFRRGRLAADRDGLGHAAIEDVEIVLDTLRRLAACVARPGAGFVFRIPSLTVPMDPSSKQTHAPWKAESSSPGTTGRMVRELRKLALAAV